MNEKLKAETVQFSMMIKGYRPTVFEKEYFTLTKTSL